MTNPFKYPILDKQEYHLAQFKLVVLAIDYLIHRAFFNIAKIFKGYAVELGIEYGSECCARSLWRC
jgi:hypothetical protein